jgi:hypothetical protein
MRQRRSASRLARAERIAGLGTAQAAEVCIAAVIALAAVGGVELAADAVTFWGAVAVAFAAFLAAQVWVARW